MERDPAKGVRPHPWARAVLAPQRLVAWPRWERECDVLAVLEAAAPAVADGFAALLLAFDETRDGAHIDRDVASERTALCVQDVFGGQEAFDGQGVEVVLVALPAERAERLAACRVAHATIAVGDLRDGLRLGGFPVPLLRDRDAVAAWRRASETVRASRRAS